MKALLLFITLFGKGIKANPKSSSSKEQMMIELPDEIGVGYASKDGT